MKCIFIHMHKTRCSYTKMSQLSRAGIVIGHFRNAPGVTFNFSQKIGLLHLFLNTAHERRFPFHSAFDICPTLSEGR